MTGGECEICGGDCSSANPPVYNCPNSYAHAREAGAQEPVASAEQAFSEWFAPVELCYTSEQKSIQGRAFGAGFRAGRASHPAPAQEPVAVPAGMTADQAWQDLCEKDDRTSIDYPGFALIRQGELAGYMAAVPVSPPAESGAVEAPAQALASAVLNYYDSAASEDTRKGLFDEMVRRAKALASAPAPQPGALKKDWVPCPICGEPDMARETDAEGHSLIRCVNHGCPSNGASSPSAWNAGAEAMKRDCAATVESFAPGGENYEPGHDDASMRVAIRGAILALPLPVQPAGEG